MKSFLKNPSEFFLNLLGYSMVKKPSMILGHMLDTTHNNWAQRMRDNGQLSNYELHLYSTEE